jgi:peptidoglycan hydrolase-like protein with peptidoglycan-binding domain
MRASLLRFVFCLVFIGATSAPHAQTADANPELLKIIQVDLSALGYDTGNVDGEHTTQTAIAISQFQAEQGLEVTGAASPQLAGVVKAAMNNKYVPAAAAASPAATQAAQPTPQALQSAQQDCLQEKMVAAEAKNKKKRGFGSLMRVVNRAAGQLGNNELSQSIAATSRDIYDVNGTASDLDSAAKDLGLTTDEVEECRNPPTQVAGQ